MSLFGVRALAVIVMLAGLGVNRQNDGAAVTVSLAEPGRRMVTFEPGNPPPEATLDNDNNEAGKCRSLLAWDTRVRTAWTRERPGELTVRFTAIDVDLVLTTILFLPDDATPKLIEHEDLHRKIAETMYRRAERPLEDELRRLARRTWRGRGDTDEAAAQDAVDDLLAAVDAFVEREVVDDLAERQRTFDRITDHGRNDADPQKAYARSVRE